MATAAAGPTVDRLVAAEAHLRAGGFGDLADALVAMRVGEPFEEALGIIAHGGSGWHHRARRQRRDNAYRALGELIAASQSARARAAAVGRAVRRYAASADWRRDRHRGRDGLPPDDLVHCLKFDILDSGGKLLSERSLRQLFDR